MWILFVCIFIWKFPKKCSRCERKEMKKKKNLRLNWLRSCSTIGVKEIWKIDGWKLFNVRIVQFVLHKRDIIDEIMFNPLAIRNNGMHIIEFVPASGIRTFQTIFEDGCSLFCLVRASASLSLAPWKIRTRKMHATSSHQFSLVDFSPILWITRL